MSKMKKSIVAITIFISVVYLMGCGSLEEKPKKATIATSPSAIVGVNIPSLTPSPEPSLSPTPTFNSLQATMSSYLATNWAPVYATLDSRAVKCDDGYQLEVPEVIDRNSNDTWSIFTCSPKPTDYKTMWTPGVVDYGKRYTEILKIDSSQKWIVSHRDFSWSNRPGAYLWTYSWTQDGNYLYMIPMTIMSGDGYSPYVYFLDSKVLYRLNLNSGDFETILPYADGRAYGYSLSPNGQYLVYAIPEEKKIIHIRDMGTGTETQLEINGDYVLTGAFVWKDDNKKVVFASALNGWDTNSAGISIFSLSIPEMGLHTLVYNDTRMLVPAPRWDGKNYYWSDENTVFLTSLNDSAEYFLDEFTLNVRSGNVIAIPTATPYPTRTPTP